MEQRYAIANPDEILSPGLVVFESIVRDNIERMKSMAGAAQRLRPHCKTHKMVDVTRMQVGMGIVKHNSAVRRQGPSFAGAQPGYVRAPRRRLRP